MLTLCLTVHFYGAVANLASIVTYGVILRCVIALVTRLFHLRVCQRESLQQYPTHRPSETVFCGCLARVRELRLEEGQR